ncbi:amino acid adenylation domain-containing protein [Longimicrobium sp.]|uniref:non-ribosomal peptide synthetase n=1 Tax=Longimicrobium sp. TaxID=2029185 RepID=UPI002BC367A8|nr:amino acid adenylation domain-containing protein [Longimicrobium sp.]HSU17560.1 amino acid adenylation domain-containing protein [Longimicrobium sp.]
MTLARDGAGLERVVAGGTGARAAFPADRCIHALIEEQAARTPDAVALVFEDASLAYRELDARANRVAHHLRRLGVGPEVPVAIALERGLELAVAILGVLKAGGAYVPLDPGYPAERLRHMLADSAAPVLLTQERLRGAVPIPPGIAVASMDGGWDAIAAEPAEPVESGVTPDNAAYVIYTSGSTGRPKGVVNAHRGVVNRLCWMQAEYGIGPGDAVLQKTPVSFDVSVWELFWPLQQGATLVMARPDGHRDPAYLAEVIERRGVTTLHFVPSMLRQFVDAADPARCRTLKRVICSGEALPPALAARFHERFAPPVTLHNLYGPTEAAVDVSHWPCERAAADVVPIGRPVWNTELYVLDAELRPVPAGASGELYIGGVQVARGYLNRPALTAERFVPDPLGGMPGARLYRTGDEARWTECESAEVRECESDSSHAEATLAPSRSRTLALHYLGRLDDQVKIRGFRIELGEVEAALRGCEGVHDCVVVAREDGGGERRLVAYVAGAAEADALRAHLRRTLPEHMVPGAFVTVDRFPVSPNGKLDRKALPAPRFEAADAEYVAPRTPAEAALAAIWREVLGLGRVGVRESFFELGGHSLLAIRAASRISRTFGAELTLDAVFENRTIEALARHLPDPPAVPAHGGRAAEVGEAASPHRLLAVIDDLSEDELDRLLGLTT